MMIMITEQKRSILKSDFRENKVQIPFKLDHVGMSHYDSIIGKDKIGKVTESEYYKFEKGLSGRIVYLTPDKYFDELERTDIYENPREGIDQSNVDRIAEDLSKGIKYNIPFINYAESSQEGRHRMMACKKLYGADTRVPCLVVEVTTATEDEIKKYADERWGGGSYWVNYIRAILDNVRNRYSGDRYDE